jgi:hypothetical protein
MHIHLVMWLYYSVTCYSKGGQVGEDSFTRLDTCGLLLVGSCERGVFTTAPSSPVNMKQGIREARCCNGPVTLRSVRQTSSEHGHTFEHVIRMCGVTDHVHILVQDQNFWRVFSKVENSFCHKISRNYDSEVPLMEVYTA